MSLPIDPADPRTFGSVSKRARHRGNARRSAVAAPRPPAIAPEAEPERLLLDAIAAGELDPHLAAIGHAIRARFELLQTVNSAKALAELNIGDSVRINRHATPRYLQGIQGTVVDLDDQSATICLHRAVGRFKTGEIRCPPLILDRVQPAVR